MNLRLTKLKQEHQELASLHSQVLQNISDRISKAYNNFFRRVKEKRKGKKVKVGFPRVKKFIISLTYPQSGFKLDSNRLHLTKVGDVPIVLHRPIEGIVRTLTIKYLKNGDWYGTFTAKETSTSFVANGKPSVGIDLGLTSYATLSDGSVIRNMRFSKQSMAKAQCLQRRISRKVKGSRNRRKAIRRFARFSNHIAQQRHDFLHKLSHRLVQSYGLIAYEKLNVAGMVKNHRLAGAIHDVGWSEFASMLSYKAASAGSWAVAVDARDSTTTCSNCGAKHPMPLSVRTYTCEQCGLVLDRDLNAARVILARGLSTAGQAGIHACGEATSTPNLVLGASCLVEAGTTCRSQVHAQ